MKRSGPPPETGISVINMHDGRHIFAFTIDLNAIVRRLHVRARNNKNREAAALGGAIVITYEGAEG